MRKVASKRNQKTIKVMGQSLPLSARPTQTLPAQPVVDTQESEPEAELVDSADDPPFGREEG